MRKQICLVAGIAAIACCLSGCMLLPEEEVFEKAPVVKEFSFTGYSLGNVQRGELIKTETLSCTYMPVKSEGLAFRVGGESLSEVFVKKGDRVKAGDVLAELWLGDLPDRIAELEGRVARMKLEARHEQENMERALTRHHLELEAAGEQAKDMKTLEDKRLELERALSRRRDALTVAELSLSELREQLAARRLVATIDGTVTYIKKHEEGERSVEGERFIKVADTTVNAFSAETANYALLSEGDQVEITVSKQAYEAEVVSPESLGLVDEGENSRGRKSVYMLLTEPAGELEGGDRGSATLVLGERQDVNYIPERALYQVDERPAVYVRDEFGLKSVRYVETGLSTGRFVEITQGLSDGEEIILK